MKLVHVCLAILLVTIPVLAFAATKKSVTINEPVAIGSTVLQPGDYKVEWDGSGPDVQVRFMRGSKTVTTVPATLEKKDTGLDGALDLKDNQGKAKDLVAIDFKDMQLKFNESSSQ